MKVSIRQATEEEKPIVVSLFNYYMYEFSRILESKLLSDGSYLKNTDLIDLYWQKDNHLPYFIEVDDEIAGFVFVRYYPEEVSVYDIDQFFVLKRYARRGVGQSAFKLCLELHPGDWLVRVLKQNDRGFKFWQNTISTVTDKNYSLKFELDLGVEMHFFRFRVGS